MTPINSITNSQISEQVPDIYVVGGARCGSTSIHRWLQSHPGVYMTWPDKEPGFYCASGGVTDPQEYFSNFSGATPGQRRGDASTYYLTCPSSPRLIYEANPDAKIIISLRNPADRAYSLYCYMRGRGHELIDTFEEALEAEDERFQRLDSDKWETYRYNYLYYRSGLYSQQVERYLKQFPKDQVRILILEEVAENPQPHLLDLLAFLNLPKEGMVLQFPNVNASLSRRSVRLQHFITHRVRPALYKYRFPFAGKFLRGLSYLNSTSKKPERPDPELMQKLFQQYEGDITATSNLIGKDLHQWWHPPSQKL